MTDATQTTVACYYCGGDIDTAPPGRLDQCRGCGKYIHACRMCRHYDPQETSKQCTEDDAEEVRDKEGANFCDYFALAADAFDKQQILADGAARSQLAALFGEAQQATDNSSERSDLLNDAEALFRK